MSLNGCIRLYGESFRLGGQTTHNRGRPESYEPQIHAANSHMSFIKETNVDMDVYLSTYDTSFSDDLRNVYGEKLIGCDLYNELIGQNNLINKALKNITVESYDFILIMRIDLFLKPLFTKLFDSTWNTIRWPCICFKPYHKCGPHPRINDMMVFIPKKYYSYLNHMYHSHDSWMHFIKNTNLTYNDLDTMLTTYHDSDSAKDFNPIYSIVNRPECSIQHTSSTDYFDKWNL
jgi:hypothetical protein